MRERQRPNHGTARASGAPRRVRMVAVVLLLALMVVGCGEKETVVAESLPTASP